MNNDKDGFTQAETELLNGGAITEGDLELARGIIQLIADGGLKAGRVESTIIEAGRLVGKYRKSCKEEAFNFLAEALKVRPDFVDDETTWKAVGSWLSIAKDLAALQ